MRFQLEQPEPRFLQTHRGQQFVWRRRARSHRGLRRRRFCASGGHRTFPAWSNGAALRELCWSATRPIARFSTTRSQTRTIVDGQALVEKLQRAQLPMIDRVEVSIIEEVQPRWLSFLNKQADVFVAGAIRLRQHRGSQWQTRAVPGEAGRAACIERSRQTYTLTYFNMEDPVVGGYTPDKVASSARHQPCDQYRSGDSAVLAWPGGAGAFGLMPNTVGYDQAYVSARSKYDLAEAQLSARHFTVTSIATATAGANSPTARRWFCNGPPRPTSARDSAMNCGAKT